MAHVDDATTRDVVEQVKKILPSIEQESDAVYYKAKKFVDDLAEVPDIDHLPGDRLLGPKGERGRVEDFRRTRDEAVTYLAALVDQYEDHHARIAETVPVNHGEVREIRDVGNPDARGNRFVEVTYNDGHVERVMRDREEFERAEATMKLRTDEAQRLQDLGHEIGQLNEIIANTHDAAAAEPLRKRRDALRTEVREGRRVLVDAIAADLRERGFSEHEIAADIKKGWGGPDSKGGFGLRYTPVEDGVNEGIAALRDGKVDDLRVVIQGSEDGTVKPMSQAARIQLREKVDADPKLRVAWEQVLKTEDPDEWKAAVGRR